MFEEEYRRLASHPDYHTLFQEVNFAAPAEEVHNGYFSIDRKDGKERWTDTAENNQTNRDNAERAYSLIMREKEKLLSFDTPLKFIFSHSALREGWDNPNVFQICALRDIRTERERRQTIGRGLRLCVNQEGLRLRGFDVNTLTVVAMESYEAFRRELAERRSSKTPGFASAWWSSISLRRFRVVSDDGKVTASRIRRVQSPVASLAGGRLYRRQGADTGFAAEGAQGRDARRSWRLYAATRGDCQGAAQAFWAIGDQGRRRAAVGSSPPRRCSTAPSSRSVVGPDQAQDHLSREVRQRSPARKMHPSTCGQAPEIPKTQLQWRKADIAIGQSGVEATETVAARQPSY